MKALIYTPLSNNSQSIPHVVEHCLWKSYPFTHDWFFKQKLFFSKEIIWEITSVSSDIWISVDEIIKFLTQNIQEDVFNYEKKVLEKECNDIHQWWLIYESMIQKIVNKKIMINDYKLCNFNEIEGYHKKYYTNENLLILDDNVWINDEFNVKFVWPTILKRFQNFVWKWKRFYHNFTFDDIQFHIFWYESFDFTTYRNLVFSWIIFDVYCTYFMRYKRWQYYYESTTFDFFNRYIWITIPKIDYTELTEDFFNQAKLYIKSILQTWSFKEKICLSKIIFDIDNARSEIINLCDNFSRYQFVDAFWEINIDL